jgi:hypothetical protein
LVDWLTCAQLRQQLCAQHSRMYIIYRDPFALQCCSPAAPTAPAPAAGARARTPCSQSGRRRFYRFCGTEGSSAWAWNACMLWTSARSDDGVVHARGEEVFRRCELLSKEQALPAQLLAQFLPDGLLLPKVFLTFLARHTSKQNGKANASQSCHADDGRVHATHARGAHTWRAARSCWLRRKGTAWVCVSAVSATSPVQCRRLWLLTVRTFFSPCSFTCTRRQQQRGRG